MAKWKALISKYREIIVYLIFGVLTTAVNWLVDFPLHRYAHFPAVASASIAWVVAVIFAFLTNKPIVFRSMDWSHKVVVPELLQFVGCRIGSGLLEVVFMFITVDVSGIGETVYFWGITHHTAMKVIAAVFVVAINYIGSKLLFRNKN